MAAKSTGAAEAMATPGDSSSTSSDPQAGQQKAKVIVYGAAAGAGVLLVAALSVVAVYVKRKRDRWRRPGGGGGGRGGEALRAEEGSVGGGIQINLPRGRSGGSLSLPPREASKAWSSGGLHPGAAAVLADLPEEAVLPLADDEDVSNRGQGSSMAAEAASSHGVFDNPLYRVSARMPSSASVVGSESIGIELQEAINVLSLDTQTQYQPSNSIPRGWGPTSHRSERGTRQRSGRTSAGGGAAMDEDDGRGHEGKPTTLPIAGGRAAQSVVSTLSEQASAFLWGPRVPRRILPPSAARPPPSVAPPAEGAAAAAVTTVMTAPSPAPSLGESPLKSKRRLLPSIASSTGASTMMMGRGGSMSTVRKRTVSGGGAPQADPRLL